MMVKMKLDIFDNSLRLLVNKSELDDLRRGLDCGGAIHFPRGQLIEYTLGPSSDAAITASFSGSSIRVGVPAGDLASFASHDRLSLSAEIPSPQARPLLVVIERDID
jgi:hypothetical protein